VPRCHKTVLEASQTFSPGWENRLTAIFATVLDQHPELTGAIFDRVGLPRGEWYEAYTEEWVTPTRRIDMQVVAHNENGAVSQLFSEHKRHGGRFSVGQREDYLGALSASGIPGRLATIVGALREDDEQQETTGMGDDEAGEEDDEAGEEDDEAGEEDSMRTDELPAGPGEPSPVERRWIPLTWQWAAEVADSVAREAPERWGGANWREQAIKSDVPAKHRALYELVWYLEEEGYAVLDALNADHAAALEHRASADEAATVLLERAGEADCMRPLVPIGRQVDYGDGWGQHFKTPAGSWVERLEGTLDLLVLGHDEWADQPTDKPALAAGVSVGEQWYRPLSAQTDWLARLRGLRVSFVVAEAGNDGYVLCYARLPVEQLIREGGETLPEQAQYVARWAGPILSRLSSDEYDPGPVTPPVKPKRRGSTRASAH
jgi:hypothetical protein